MNRRKFLKRLGLGATVVAVAPIAVKAACTCMSGFKPLIGTAEEWCDIHGTPLVECSPILKEYAEYCDFSKFANCEAIDKVVMNAAGELGRQAGESLSYMYSREGLEAAGW